VNGQYYSIDVADAARMEYGPGIKVGYGNWNDPYSWFAYRDGI